MKGLLPALLGLVTLIACNENKTTPDVEAADVKQSGDAAVTGAPQVPGKTASHPTTQDVAGKTPKTTCPQGSWFYDYGDNALEAMLKQIPSAKLTRKEGSFTCTFPEGNQGTVNCSTGGGKPVINEISANQGGMPFVLLMEMSGSTTSQFKLQGDGTLQMSNSDMSGFTVNTKATIAGNQIPFPAKELVMGLAPEDETVTFSYKCEGETLQLRPQVEGVSVWQVLKRVP